MSRERLEEIKENWNNVVWGIDKSDINWLIEQAERVQELEDIIYQDKRQAVLEGLCEQNNRYREAIEMALSDIDDYDFESVRLGLRKALEGEE